MDTTGQLKKNAEFVLAKFTENFEISKVSHKQLSDDYGFSFEIVSYGQDGTPNNEGIPFTVTILSDGYLNVYRDDANVCVEFSIEDFEDHNFFNNFLQQF